MGGKSNRAARCVAVAFMAVSLVVLVAALRSPRATARHVHVQTRADPVMAGTVLTAPESTTSSPPPVTAAPPTVATAPAAPAHDRVVFDRSPADVGREALALITYPWQDRLDVSIAFAGPRSGMRAESTAYGDHEEITVFVRATDTPRLVAVSIAHELGHLIDWRLNTDDERARWLAARHRPDAAWWTCDYCTDYSYGSGDFAETFAAWAVGPFDYRSQLAPLPSPAELQSLSRFFH